MKLTDENMDYQDSGKVAKTRAAKPLKDVSSPPGVYAMAELMGQPITHHREDLRAVVARLEVRTNKENRDARFYKMGCEDMRQAILNHIDNIDAAQEGPAATTAPSTALTEAHVRAADEAWLKAEGGIRGAIRATFAAGYEAAVNERAAAPSTVAGEPPKHRGEYSTHQQQADACAALATPPAQGVEPGVFVVDAAIQDVSDEAISLTAKRLRESGLPNVAQIMLTLSALLNGARTALATPPAQVGESYPDGVTERNHIAHDMRVGRFPKRSSIAEFLAERAPPAPSVPWEEQAALPDNLADLIEAELMQWRGANGGIYTIRTCALAVSIKLRALLSKSAKGETK